MAEPRGWLTASEWVAEYWPNAPFEFSDEADQAHLENLLTSARIQCEAYAPALEAGADVPKNYLLAQAMQARALYRATIAGTGDEIVGPDGMTVTVYPMDRAIKNLLRPRNPVPVFG